MLSTLIVALFNLCIFSLSLGQLATIARFGDFKLYFFDLVVLLYSVIGLYYFLAIKKSFQIQKIYFGFISLILWMLVIFPLGTTELNETQVSVALFYLGRFAIYIVAFLVTRNLISNKILSLEQFLTTLYLSGLFVSISGFFQLVLFPDFAELDPMLGLDPHKNRLASTFLDPNFAGGYLSLIISVAIGSYLFNLYKWSVSKIFLFIGIPMVAMFLTFSRSSWAMLAVSIFIYGLFKSRLFLFLSLILIFGAYFAIPRVQTRITGTTDPADSAAFRLVSWNNATKIAQDNLLFGVGYNTYRYAQSDYGFIEKGETGGNSGAGADSSFLLILATTGLIGFILFTIPILNSLFVSFFISRNLLVFATLSGLILHSQFVNSLLYPQFLFIWPLLLDTELFRKPSTT